MHEPRCSAKCPCNSGRTRPISTSGWIRTRCALDDADADCVQRFLGTSGSKDKVAALRTNCRRERVRAIGKVQKFDFDGAARLVKPASLRSNPGFFVKFRPRG